MARVGDEDRRVAPQRLGQHARIVGGNARADFQIVAGLVERQHLFLLVPLEHLDAIIAIAGTNDIGDLAQQLLAIQDRADPAADLQAGAQLGQLALILLVIHAHQPIGQVGDLGQLLHRHGIDIRDRDQPWLVAEVIRQRLATRSLAGQFERLRGKIRRRGLDRGGHAAVGDRRQRRWVAVDPDDQGALGQQPQRPPGVAPGQRQRVRKAEDRVDRRVELLHGCGDRIQCALVAPSAGNMRDSNIRKCGQGFVVRRPAGCAHPRRGRPAARRSPAHGPWP